jgi:phage terminase large subunit-like protein
MLVATKTTRRTRSRSSTTNSRRGDKGDLPELASFERFCSLLTLENGEPLRLEPFQRQMIRDYFAGVRETLILLPKKNGKSTILSALALHHIVTTPDAECVIAAASREQAGILFGQAAGFVRRSESLQQRVRPTLRELRSKKDSGKVRVLASDVDTADGVIPTLALVDELHRHKRSDLYGVFRDGLGPRGGRMLTISTAGDYDDSPLGRMRNRAYELPGLQRDGAYRYVKSPDGAYAMHEWALDADADFDDLELVKTANPASWQTIDELRKRHDSPSMTTWQWARFACGAWVQGEDSAISPLDWAKCGGGNDLPDGASVWLGVDLGWKWDTTAIVPVRTDRGRFEVGVPVVVVPPRDGTSTREEDILDPIDALTRRFNVAGVVLDPNAGGEQLAQRLEARKIRVVTHSQDPAPMALAAERLSTAVREGALTHPDDATLTAHVLAAQAKPVSGEKWRLVKPKRGGRVIDAAVALAMVLSVVQAQAQRPKPRFEVLA